MKNLNQFDVTQVAGGSDFATHMICAATGAVVGVWMGSAFQSMFDLHLVDESKRLVQFYENQVRQLNAEVHTILTQVNPSPAQIVKV